MTCYILYPSRQDLRPEIFPRRNVFTWILGKIYAFDTNTGVCPSLHVAYSLAILSVAWKDEYIRKPYKSILLVLVIAVSLATNFVKQHSYLDMLATIPTALVGEWLIFHNHNTTKKAVTQLGIRYQTTNKLYPRNRTQFILSVI